MNPIVGQSIARSATTFRSIVWPRISEGLGGGELIPVETVTESKFAGWLDTLGMTDAWQLVQSIGIRGLATRVQPNPPTDWRTWTVRKQLPSGNPTEWHKLLRDGHWHLPSYIVQAYVRDGRLLSAAAIATEDLAMCLRMGAWHQLTNKQDGNLFVAVSWADAERLNCPVIYADDTSRPLVL